jgi:carbonic anhydrase
MSNQQAKRSSTAAGSGVGRASGFALTDSGGRPKDENIDTALARNRAFASDGGYEGAVVFPALRLFVITCLDPRVDPAHFLGLGLSDAVVLRNVGGRVTPEVINDVAFISQITETVISDGPLFEVAVIPHNQCGTGALADDKFRRRYAERTGSKRPRCASMPSSTPRQPSRGTWGSYAPHPRSPRASACPGMSTT